MTWPTTNSSISWASTSLGRTAQVAARPGFTATAAGCARAEDSANAGSVPQSQREEQHRPGDPPPITPGFHLGVADLPVRGIELRHRHLPHLAPTFDRLPQQIGLQLVAVQP